MRHLTEDDLVLLYYDEPGAPHQARVHLAQCPECRAAAESLAQTLDVCNALAVPEPDAQFGRSVWARLVPQLESRRKPFAPRFWITAAAMAALMIAAFLAGRFSWQPAPAITAGLSAQARERILAISVADHLERAQLLLTEISNMSDTDAAELAADRSHARDLANENRLMRQVILSSHENAGMAPLLDDVGRFVLEVANAPDKVTAADVRDLKLRLDSESLLFKIRILETNLRTSKTTGRNS